MNESTYHDLRPKITTDRTLIGGEQIGTGDEGIYRRLASGAGEPYLLRRELFPGTPNHAPRRSVFYRAVVTDFHVVDTASPGRFEFAQRFYGSKGLDLLLPAYRPQDCLQRYAVDAAIRTLNTLGPSAITGAALEGIVCLGDLSDNAQRNELRQVMDLWVGGIVEPWTPGVGLEGTGADSWPESSFWHPSEFMDDYKRRWGFSAFPEVLEALSRPFTTHGCSLPWIAAHGNHDALVLGGAVPNPAYERLVVGAEKARALPRTLDIFRHLDLFISYPELFLTGPAASVTPSEERRSVDSQEFVRSLQKAGGEPNGHGFTDENLLKSHTYYVDDSNAEVRLIMLDTVNLSGHYHGSVGWRQYRWLEQRLAEVHSRYWTAENLPITTINPDRLVVISSHHGLDTLINDMSDPKRDADLPRVLGPEIETLLHRFPNVILWINGHTHRNAVRPRCDPSGNTGGFWEVTTSSLIDWPVQSRLIEVVDSGNESISIYTTMVDHAGAADPREEDATWRLASIHRELAANDPHAGIRAGKQGIPSDRNVELLLPHPFGLG